MGLLQSARSSAQDLAERRLSLARIAGASTLIDPAFLRSPFVRSTALSSHFGCEIWLKDETSNPIGCFKGRGAEYFAETALRRGEKGPWVCASAGNFGLALAHACAHRGIELRVFVAKDASAAKVQAIERYGVPIVREGHDFDAAKSAAKASARDQGARFVEDGAEPEIAEGAGTIALEILARETPHTIIVPLGNGALLAGIARWTKVHAPDTKVIGVCSAGARVMFDALKGEPPAKLEAATANTIADGIAVRVPVPQALEDLEGLVDDVLLVRDEHLIEAMRLMYALEGLIREPSAVAGLAGIACNRERFRGQRVATIVTGRNLAQAQVKSWLTGTQRLSSNS